MVARFLWPETMPWLSSAVGDTAIWILLRMVRDDKGLSLSLQRLIFEASPMVLVFSEPTWLFAWAATFSARPLLQWIQRLSAILLYSTLPTVENAMHHASWSQTAEMLHCSEPKRQSMHARQRRRG